MLVRIPRNARMEALLPRAAVPVPCVCWFVIRGLLLSVVLLGIGVSFRKKELKHLFRKKKNSFKELNGLCKQI